MGTLKDFAGQLDAWRRVLERTEARLCEVQEKFETFFAEIERVREGELDQLRAHLLEQRGSLPEGLDAQLDAAWKAAELTLEEELKQLRGRHQKLVAEAEKTRRHSINRESKLRKKNVELDAEEEALKERNAELLARIERYQAQIRELGSGFGFFKNLFALNRLHGERKALLEEQGDVRARIEGLREAWRVADEKGDQEESKLQATWVEQMTEAQGVQTKIDHIEQVRGRLLERSALERVLFERSPKLPPVPSEGAVPCERCKTANHTAQHFCAICGRRLGEDRPDLLGSLAEVAELNHHHQRFSAGVKACQEIIGLCRGLISGMGNFRESVDSMIDTEDRHPVSKLSIDVPAAAVSYAANFGRLESAANVEKGLHPEAFAAQIGQAMESVYGAEQIQAFFETMGEELSREANRQW